MKPLGIVGAVVAAALGAVLWGLIAWKLNMEIGYVAWGIGLAVGFGSAIFGGRGAANGVLCAVIALVGMMGGKMLAVKWALPDMLKTEFQGKVTKEMYDGAMASADNFKTVSGDDQTKAFMVTDGYTEATSPEKVTQVEFDEFKTEQAPRLKSWGTAHPTFEQFQSEIVGSVTSEASKGIGSADLFEAAKEDLGIIDIVFAVIGIMSAFRLGGQPEVESAPVWKPSPSPYQAGSDDPPPQP